MSKPTQTNVGYDSNEDIKIVAINTDYAVMLKDVLTRLDEGLGVDEIDKDNLINLVRTAKDYLFYLEDNRRAIL